MIADLGAVVDLFVTDTATIKRPAPDAYDVNGRATPRAFATSTAKVCVQPLSGEQLRRLPPGSDNSERVSIWARTRLQIGDIVTLAGEEFEIDDVEDWQVLAQYSRALALRRGRSEARP
jgi:hypothetical protein